MFCRFGLIEASRPVAVFVCSSVVCRRPSGPIAAGQLLEVGLDELRQLAPALDLLDDRVLVADRLQHARVGREAGLAAALARQPELDEQHLGELLRRADHELLAGQLPDLALERAGVGAHAQPGLLEPRGVELDAGLLGLAQHVDERQLDVVQEVLEAALAQLLALAAGELVDQHRARPPAGRRPRPPCRAPRTARRAGSRGAPGRAGRRRPRCRRRGSAGPRRAPWRRGRCTGRSPAARDELGGVVDLAGQRVRPAGVGAEAPARRARAAARPRGSRAPWRRARARRRSAVRRPPAPPLRTATVRAVAASGRGIAADSAASSASSSRRSGSRSSKSRNISRRRERSGSRVSSAREVELDRHVADHRREPLGDARVLGELGQVLLALGAGDLVDVGEHLLERAEALEQLGGRLVADPGDAGDVVATCRP